jgi:hypothetical protein
MASFQYDAKKRTARIHFRYADKPAGSPVESSGENGPYDAPADEASLGNIFW